MKKPNHGLGAKLTMATAAFMLAAASSGLAAPATINWGTVANNVRTLPTITYGTRITSAQLNAAAANATGTFSYQINGASAENQLLNAGKSYKIIATFTANPSNQAGIDNTSTYEALIDVDQFTITYAPKAPSTGNFARNYGDAKLTFTAGDANTVTYSAFANNETLNTVIANAASVQLQEVNSITVGSTTTVLSSTTVPGVYEGGINFAVAPIANANYKLSAVNDGKATLRIDRRPLRINVTTTDSFYGDTPVTPGATATTGDLLAADADTAGTGTPNGIRITPSFVGTVTSTSPAGDYAATALVTDGTGANAKIDRYILTVNNQKFTIKKRTVQPSIVVKDTTATTKTIAYGDNNPEYALVYANGGKGDLTGDGKGFAGTETSSVFTTAPAVVQPAARPNAGTVTVGYTTGAAAANYEFDLSKTATLVVAPRAVTITAQDITRVFGGKNYTPSFTVQPTVAATSTAVGAGYAPFHSQPSDLYTSTGVVVAFEGPASTDTQGGDGVDTSGNPVTPIGEYANKVLPKSGTDTGRNSNYTITIVNGKVVVTKVLAIIDWANFNSAALTYGDKLDATKHFNATIKFNNNTITPVVDMTGTSSAVSTGAGVLRYTATASATANNPAGSLNTTTLLNADTYTITATFTPDAANQGSLAVTVATKSITVNKAVLTVTTKDQSKAYAAAVPSTTPVVGTTLDIAGFKNSETATTAGITPALALDYSGASSSSDVGTFVIKSTGGQDTKNYSITRVDTGKLTVTPIDPPGLDWVLPSTKVSATQFANITYGTLLGDAQKGGVSAPNLTGSVDYFWVNGTTEVAYASAGLTVNNGAVHTLRAKFTTLKNGARDNNYNIKSVDRTIKVDAKALTVAAPTGKTSVYGSAIQASVTSGTASGTYLIADGVTLTGIVDNGVINDSTFITVKYTTTATQSSDAGTYPLTANLTDSGNRLANYSLSIGSGTYTITKKPLIVKVKGSTAKPGVFTKDFLATPASPAINPSTELSYVDSTGANGFVTLASSTQQTPAVLTTLPTVTITKKGDLATTQAVTATTPVGEYGVKLADAVATNYSFTYDTAGIYEITKIKPTLTWTQFAAITQPIKYGDTYASLLGTSVPVASRAVGDTATGAPGTVTVNKAADSGYDATLDTWSANSVDASNTPTSTADSNKRKITVTFTPGASEVNYQSFTQDYFVQVVKRKVNVEIDGTDLGLDTAGAAVKGGLSRAYGEFNRPFTVKYTNGESDTKKIFGITDDVSAVGLDVQPIPYSSALPETAPGSYSTIATGAVSFRSPGQAPSDSDFHFVTSANDGEKAFTVTKRKIKISVEAKTRPFGSANGQFVVTGDNFGINNKGETDTIAKFSSQPQVVTAATATSPASTTAYVVFVSGSASANYEITHANSSVTVTPAVPTFTWSVGGPIVYGTPLSAVQLAARAWAGTTDITTFGVFSYADNAAGTIQNVGSKRLVAKFTSNSGNYASVNVVTSDNDLVVTPATLTAKAANASIVYGDATPAKFAIEYGSFANPNDNANNITAPAVSTDRPVTSAGTYALTVAGGVVGNYNITPVAGGVLTVTKKPVTIVAKAVSRAYGAAPTFDAVPYTIAPALVGTDSLGSDITVTSSTAASANVGTYNLTVAGGQGNSNYDVTYDGTGKLTVTPAAVTVAVKDVTKKYLDAVPVFELNITPALLFNDTITSIVYTLDSSAVKADSVVGTYAVKLTGAATQGNYAVTFKDGVVTVEKATPTIVWSKPASIAYGSALSSVQLNAKAETAGKDVAGTFAYTPASGDTSLKAGVDRALSVVFTPTDAANYTTATGSTTIDINKAVPTITWATPTAITYGTALGSSQLNASASVAGTFAYTPAAGAVLTAGSQALSGSFTPTDADNYATATGSTTVEVKKAAAVVSADAKSKQFNAALPDLTATITGLVNGDSSSAITGLKLTTTATASSPIGSYSIRQDGALTAANYDISFVASTLTVTKATPAVVWAAPADITVGTALGDTQLNATSTVAGVFAYVPTKGTVLPLGNGQKLEAIFIPSDAVNYELVRSVNTINVTTPAAKPVNPADINGDGSSDLVFQHTDGFLAAWFLDGATLKQGVLFSPETAGDARWEVVGYGDFNGDSKGDILFQYNGGNFDGALAIWYLNGTQLLEAKLVTPESNPGAGWDAVAVADINGDKKADIVFQHTEGFLAAWFQDGANSIGKTLLNPVAPFGLDGTVDAGWRVVAATDLNGDKKTDLVFQYSGGAFDRTVAVWYMNGINQTGADLLSPSNPGAGWSVVAAADYNGDSKNDLVLQHTSGLLGIWYLNGVTQTSATLVTPETPGAGWRAVAP